MEININPIEANEAAVDRLSSLPDSVIHRILSLLPTLIVIRAAVLSSHWRRLSADHLRHASTLDFSNFSSSLHRPGNFAAAVTTIIRRHSGILVTTFRLTFNPGAAHNSAAAEWVAFAAARGVEELELDFRRPIRHRFLSGGRHVIGRSEAFELLPGAALPSTLARLSLSRCILAAGPTAGSLPSLTRLFLRDVHVTDAMLESLLDASPVLEQLVLRECGSLTRVRVGPGPGPLETLTVYECPNAASVEVSGGRIRSVLLSAGHVETCVMEDLGMLEEAFLGTRGDEFGGVLCIFKNVLSSLSHVCKLALYLGHLVPGLVKDLRVNFSNLRELELMNSPLFGLFSTDVFCFFNHCDCPILENLTIELSAMSNDVLEFRTSKVQPLEVVFDHLKNVKLRNFENPKTGLELTTYFLKKSPILDAMFLVLPRRSQREKERKDRALSHVLDAILELPKSSPNVRIVVCEHDERDSLLQFLKKHQVADVFNIR